MKAIETNYKGYRFRSRLEARWAVFFDELKIRWEYELEGYEMLDGSRYLPDFFLPGFHGDLFVEVKPFGVDSHGLVKPMRFASQSETPLLLAIGVPDKKPYSLVGAHIEPWESDVAFCGKYLAGGANADEYRLYWQPGDCTCLGIDHAILAARAARFDGQTL